MLLNVHFYVDDTFTPKFKLSTFNLIPSNFYTLHC